MRPIKQTKPLLEPHTMERRTALGLACMLPGLVATPAQALDASDVINLKYFPGSLSSAAVDAAVGKKLAARGYTKDNTLFGMSVCSDEVNFVEGEVIDLMKRRWGETFSLGGLAGVPFAGKAGLSAYAHHVPDEGKLFIFVAPHVGVGSDGKVGALDRAGIVATSSACGAAVGAYKTLKGGAAPPTKVSDLADLQFEYIKMKLASKLDGVNNAANGAPPIEPVCVCCLVAERGRGVTARGTAAEVHPWSSSPLQTWPSSRTKCIAWSLRQ